MFDQKAAVMTTDEQLLYQGIKRTSVDRSVCVYEDGPSDDQSRYDSGYRANRLGHIGLSDEQNKV